MRARLQQAANLRTRCAIARSRWFIPSHFWQAVVMSRSPAGRTHREAMDDAAARDPAHKAALERLLPYERIARQVIGLRMEMELSQEELARRVGTSASAIARLESGQHRPSVETLRRVARAVDRELVIGFQNPAPPKPAAHGTGQRATTKRETPPKKTPGANRGRSTSASTETTSRSNPLPKVPA